MSTVRFRAGTATVIFCVHRHLGGVVISLSGTGSMIVKPTRNELFSERQGVKRNRRLFGWSWRWQPARRPLPPSQES